jgi:hypothetical protein
MLDQEIFPRRRMAWHESSRGTAYRVALLPDNPHFQQDVHSVRKVLGIPEGQVRTVPGDATRSRLAKWTEDFKLPREVVEVVVDRELAHRWASQHQRAAVGEGPDKFIVGLAPEALDSARRSAAIDLSRIQDPQWLRVRPKPHAQCPWGETLPLHWAVARLLERHRLSSHLCPFVMSHVLTRRREDLLDLEPTNIKMSHGSGEISISQPEHSFAVTVQGIDEFTTKEQWDHIWKEYVEPSQQEFLDRRGQRPQGQMAPQLERLRQAMPLYRSRLEFGSIKAALDDLQDQGAPEGELETETARRLLMDLDDLLGPV